MAIPLAVIVGLACIAWLSLRIFRFCAFRSPLDDVPGPAWHSFLTGNMRPLFDRQTALSYQQDLFEKYGPVMKIHGLFGSKVLCISDSKALQHIFREYSTFIHAPFVLTSMRVFFGPGLLSTEGHPHRMQRKLLNPLFTVNVMRELTPMMFSLASELGDAMLSEVLKSGSRVDVEDWMVHASLEGIGRLGLGHSFVPFHEASSTDNTAAEVVKRLADIFEARKAALENEALDDMNIMSILLKEDGEVMRNGGDRLSEEELIAQIRTLLFAAVDTTSNSLSRILHILAECPDVQDRLRKEIRAAKDCHGSELSYDQLNELKLLDAVCRETLRLHTSVTFSLRYAAEDAIIPLSKPIRGLNHKALDQFVVPKGTEIILNWQGCNRDKAIWGEDAMEWKPERWFRLPQTVLEARLPGIMTNFGYRFAMLEIKAVLLAILDRFKFSLTGEEIFWNYGAINFPTMDTNSSLPSLVLHVEVA
ncbi:hypothetical protein PHLGIDRAFT_34578 [Phlebiopsis gigantea 11061_1 CR5-6]|uniref:Cytochrome P450 n=1 Tax=Phlebiopsis gigantea (strain 11061_1 CR5-6) TaxID=745531 RepID=A0A0C3SAG3_PHLG1|nr:hypothetical protein PHLGIDRAFT_34578 [Phlebiopsis gigantea 11061_1 CR5-6]